MKPLPDGAFITNDFVAAVLMRTLKEHGIDIPADIKSYLIGIKEADKRASAAKQKGVDSMDVRNGRQKNSNYSNWQFWQQHNKPIEILTQKMYAEIVFYIHHYPVVSGFVYEAEQWVYSTKNPVGG